MELIALGALTGFAALSNEYFLDGGPNAFDVKKKSNLRSLAMNHARNIRDAGDVYFIQGRPNQAANAQLDFISDWYLPMSNPTQEPTYDLNEVINSRASNQALLESQAPRYIFDSKDTLGIAYGAGQKNNGYNIGVPFPGISFMGDPNDSLANGAKVFVDNFDYPPNDYTNRYFMAAGEPTVNLRADLGDEADVPISNRNPYGPFGYYQAIMRNRLYGKTLEDPDTGIRPSVLRPPKRKRNVRFARPQPSDVYF